VLVVATRVVLVVAAVLLGQKVARHQAAKEARVAHAAKGKVVRAAAEEAAPDASGDWIFCDKIILDLNI